MKSILSASLLSFLSFSRSRQFISHAASEDYPKIINYQIDPSTSEIRMLVYMGGPAALFGHSHVIVSNDCEGTIIVENDKVKSVKVIAPIITLQVDVPKHRLEEPEPTFHRLVSQSDIDGTRERMLGVSVLDVDSFPYASCECFSNDDNNLSCNISIHGVTKKINIPIRYNFLSDILSIQGSCYLFQKDFNIKPYSLFFGSLKLEDRITAKFKIVGSRSSLNISHKDSKQNSPIASYYKFDDIYKIMLLSE